MDAIAGGVFGEPKHLCAVSEEGPLAQGGVEGGPRVERGQVGHELDRCLSFSSGQRSDAGEEILIRKARRESEHVRIHAPCVSR